MLPIHAVRSQLGWLSRRLTSPHTSGIVRRLVLFVHLGQSCMESEAGAGRLPVYRVECEEKVELSRLRVWLRLLADLGRFGETCLTLKE